MSRLVAVFAGLHSVRWAIAQTQDDPVSGLVDCYPRGCDCLATGSSSCQKSSGLSSPQCQESISVCGSGTCSGQWCGYRCGASGCSDGGASGNVPDPGPPSSAYPLHMKDNRCTQSFGSQPCTSITCRSTPDDCRDGLSIHFSSNHCGPYFDFAKDSYCACPRMGGGNDKCEIVKKSPGTYTYKATPNATLVNGDASSARVGLLAVLLSCIAAVNV